MPIPHASRPYWHALPASQGSGQCRHVVESTVVLSAPANECVITLTINGEKENLTEIVHDMCRMAIEHATKPLQRPALDVTLEDSWP